MLDDKWMKNSIFNALRSYSVWFWGILSISLFHRIFAVGYYGKHTFSPTYATGGIPNALRMWVDFYGESTLLGLANDVIFSAVAAVPILLAPVWLRYFALFCLAAFYAANYDHIKFNRGNIDFSTAGVGFDFTFIQGMLSQDLLVLAGALFGIGAAITLVQRARIVRLIFSASSIIVILTAFTAPLSGSFSNPLWLQTNPFLGSPLKASAINTTREFSVDALLPKSASSGTRAEYNVLLVYMEGLSEHSLGVGDMEFLSSLAADNIHFTRYVGHQLITANGLYASLTGDLPNFARRRHKWSDADANSHVMRNALPNAMRSQGYQTSFLQSALLSFMSKDQIMPLFGYDVVLGRNAWETFYSEDGWGIDDRALFEHVVDYIDTLPSDEKWFVSVLTTGTHALYNVPSDFLPSSASDRYRSLRYLDNAIRGLMTSLRDRGLLDNTVVIFTSDESRERSFSGKIQNQFALNWLPLIVVHPSSVQSSFDGYIQARQLPDIVQNILTNDLDSYFDSLRTDSLPIVFGNIFSRRFFWFDQENRFLLACITSSFVCAEYVDVTDPFTMSDRLPDSVKLYPKLKSLIVQVENTPQLSSHHHD